MNEFLPFAFLNRWFRATSTKLWFLNVVASFQKMQLWLSSTKPKQVQNTSAHKYSKHKWNVYQSFFNGSKCLFIHNNTNQGPYSHILVEYMASNKDARTMEMHDLIALSSKEIQYKIPLPWHYVDLPPSSKYMGRTQSVSLIVITLHWLCRG